MGNIITFDKNDTEVSLSMSNSGTDVFLNVLLISGSPLAETVDQKRLLVFLAEKDQIVSKGCSGFDITELPLAPDTFNEDKAFLISVINAAREQKNWALLDYTPNADIINRYLDKFEAMISAFTVHDINKTALQDWLSDKDSDDPVNCGFPRCRKHGVFLSFFGCQICNS